MLNRYLNSQKIIGGKKKRVISLDHIQQKLILGTKEEWRWGDEPEKPSRKVQIASYNIALQILKEQKKGRAKTALLHMKSEHPALVQLCTWITTRKGFELVETTTRKIEFVKRKRI